MTGRSKMFPNGTKILTILLEGTISALRNDAGHVIAGKRNAKNWISERLKGKNSFQ